MHKLCKKKPTDKFFFSMNLSVFFLEALPKHTDHVDIHCIPLKTTCTLCDSIVFSPAGGCPAMNPPVDNSSCDPPCLMPKSFCSEVSSSLFSYHQFNCKQKEGEENLIEEYLVYRQRCTNNNRVNRIKTIKRRKPESTRFLDEWRCLRSV